MKDIQNYVEKIRGNYAEKKADKLEELRALDKKARRTAPVEADYVGYEIEDAFVVGYGLDYAERYRQLPYIGVLRKEVYEK